MTDPIPVVDLFSGPGGMAEGFAAFNSPLGRPGFKVVLSIEKDPIAHRTLLLRNFLRKFPSGFPPEYYNFLNGDTPQEADWAALYTAEWEEARYETQCLTLGAPKATSLVKERIVEIRTTHGSRTVLLGGPPCQSYSLAGRGRNVGNADYNPATDRRQSLYREYARVLTQLQPAIAVMENVRGMLSARHGGQLIFPEIMNSLTHAGGEHRYCLHSLVYDNPRRSWNDGLNPKDFLVRAEEHGIPQKRHRVFIICIRSDIAATLNGDVLPTLSRTEATASLHDVIGAMPKLRSRLSYNDDDASWQHVLKNGHKLVLEHMPDMPSDRIQKFRHALDCAEESTMGNTLPYRDTHGDTDYPVACPPDLRNWLFDSRLTRLTNHETRGHIGDDITRYLYAAAYALASGKSPRIPDFPPELAARHRSWNDGKFEDRFRVQVRDYPSTTITSHISKDGHYFIHPDPAQCRSLTVREAARLQTFPDNYFFHGCRTRQYVQVGNAVPPYLAWQIAREIWTALDLHQQRCEVMAHQPTEFSKRTRPTSLEPSASESAL